ncbi:dynein heavy chain, partial [Thraustotheca clavata]
QEKVQRSLLHMLTLEMASGFGQLGTVSMEEIFKDTDKKTPCIFVLSAGADPTGMLLRFAKDRQFSDRLHLISLGQGQGPRAEALIETSKAIGDWVLLQNCHLAKSWMPALEKKVDDLAVDPSVQDTFRLFLTSFPASYFPVTAQVWKKLLSSLVFFHAIIQERRKFGALGWNIKYEFNDTDLETSYECLKKFLIEQPTIPWDALRYVTGQINYGGRVTDDWDRRCLTSILNSYYTPQVLNDGYAFSSSGIYYAPSASAYNAVMEYFEALPAHASPEIFGMHENANVTFERNESWQMTNIILSLEPRDSGGGGGGGISNDDKVLALVSSIQSNLPLILKLDEAGETTFKTRMVLGTVVMDSLATVLSQEIVKFNNLLTKMRASLTDIQRAIQGLIVMSSDLDNMYTSFLNGKVPGVWEVVSFASLKSLGPWVQDLLSRVSFFRQWLVNGEPVIFPLPAFFFPQGFMTGTLQNFARKYQTAIDCLGFTFSVLDTDPASITESPSDGIYVDGLWLEGAKWNGKKKSLEEARPGEMFSPMALVHFLPAANIVRKKEDYPCPVYKTSVRKGTLSTTGMSTNFVVAVIFIKFGLIIIHFVSEQMLQRVQSWRIILASQSPRRHELLTNLGLRFEVVPSTFEENLDKSKFPTPEDYVIENAKQKALEVFERLNCNADLVIGCDTVVVHDGKILEKPKDEADAFQMLRFLSNSTHQVYSGVALCTPSTTHVFGHVTQVHFLPLDDRTILDYIATGEPMDKAGAYGIQSGGRAFVKNVEGCMNNVIGFPIDRFICVMGNMRVVLVVLIFILGVEAWVKQRWDHSKAFKKIGHEQVPCAMEKQPTACCLCWKIMYEIENHLNKTQNDHKMEVVFRISEEKKQIPYSRSEGRILEVLDDVCSHVTLEGNGIEYAVANACEHFIDEFADELTLAFYNNLAPQEARMCYDTLQVCSRDNPPTLEMTPKEEL